MKLWVGLFIGILLGVAGTIGGYILLRETELGDEGVTIVFTEAEIQEKLGRKFPKSERLLEIIPVEIGEPYVKFLGESNRVQITMEADVSVPLVDTFKTEAVSTTSVRYEPKDYTLRLSDITMEDFRVSKLPENLQEPLSLALTAVARAYFDDYPVHEVDSKDFEDEMVQMFVKDLKVKKGRLEVRLGL
ncbi:MAG: DUF1439 domain-containing protein [Akkermansiaceae bacterium]